MHPLLLHLRRYLWIDGRSDRREWWVIMIASIFLGMQLEVRGVFARPLYGVEYGLEGIVRILLAGLLFWIDLASTIRRLHDRGKPGWKVLPYAVPGIGWAWMVIECGILPSQKGRNRYGPQPDTADAKTTLPGLQQILTSLDSKAKRVEGPWGERDAPINAAQRAAARPTPTRASTRPPASQPAMARERTRSARRPVVQSRAVTRVDQSRGKTILILVAAAIMGLLIATYVMSSNATGVRAAAPSITE